MFYNFEVIILFFERISPLHSSLFPISEVHRHAFTNHLTSVTTCFPLLPGCHSLPHISISPRNSSLFPISWVHHHTFTKHLTSAITCFPRLPGYQTLPRMHIPPLAFFSFPYFRGASLDFGAATHLGATCFPPLSGVPLPVSHRHLTPQTSLPPRLPGCQPLPHMHISPLAFFSFPHFRGATPCLTSASHPANVSFPPPSGVLPSAIRILGIFPCGTISAEQRMHRISREEGDVECRTV